MTHVADEVEKHNWRPTEPVEISERAEWGMRSRRFRSTLRRFWEEAVALIVCGIALAVVRAGIELAWLVFVVALGFAGNRLKDRAKPKSKANVDQSDYSDRDFHDDVFSGTTFSNAQFTGTVLRKATMLGTASFNVCLLYTSPSPRDRQKSRMPSSA